MKTFLFIIALLPIGVMGQTGTTAKTIDKALVCYNGKTYASKFEVTNLEYREFYANILQKGTAEERNKYAIDSLNWRDKLAYNEPFVELYYRHPAYNTYPAVNVSYDGAVRYCEWLTEKYNNDPKRKFNKVKFRLPTESEWEEAARNGLTDGTYPWGIPTLMNHKGQFLANFLHVDDACVSRDAETKEIRFMGAIGPFYLSDNADITAPVNSYFPSSLGFYNQSGNVAEMVSERGIAKGGSWKCTGYDLRIESEMKYTKSQTDIGFRLFMEIQN
jgi:formylglycine-generating enzyme required for sulfatase activity